MANSGKGYSIISYSDVDAPHLVYACGLLSIKILRAKKRATVDLTLCVVVLSS